MKLKNEIRLENLRTLISEAGNQAKLAELIGVAPSYINTLTKQRIDSATGKSKGIGESTARKLEAAMNKPIGWLDQDHSQTGDTPEGYIELTYYDIQSSAGHGKYAPVEYTPVLSKLYVLEDWALENFGRGAVDKMRVITNSGDSMSPTINDGDVLFVDITQREFIADGIYVINWNGRLLTKRLKAMLDGRLAVISDNKEYETEYITQKDVDDLAICGAVKKWWSLKG